METIRRIAVATFCLGILLLALPSLTKTVRAPWAPPVAREESDLDGNGTVNIVDLATAAIAFGSACALAPCPAAWDTRADINNDGVINIIDIATIALYFGSTCGVPPPGWNSNADINNDNMVNIVDSGIFALANPSMLGGPGWNPEADLNGDGFVNAVDAGIFAAAFPSFC